MTARIREFLKRRTDEGPCLVVDLDVVRDNYLSFAKALPDTRVFYAVKANPAPEILKLLAELGSCFDVASVERDRGGARRRRHAGPHLLRQHRSRRRARSPPPSGSASRCSRSTARPRSRRSRAPRPARRVICRIHCDGTGAEWPLSRKFGCEPDYAADILEHAHRRGLVPYGISFHVGSQQHNVEAWDRALASTAAIFRACAERGINAVDGQSRRRLPGQVHAQDAEARSPTARRSSARCASISATRSRTPSSSRAAASSAMPA